MSRITRRALLVSAAALSVPPLFAAQGLRLPSPRRRALIDIHHHWHSRELVRWWGYDSFDPSWSIDHSLAAMEESGVTAAILSVTTPGVWNTRDPQGSISLARVCNESMAQTARDHKGRYGFFAVLATPQIDASVAEIGYALDALKADGIALLSSYDGNYLGEAQFAPLWEELNRRHAVVYVHPSEPACCSKLLPNAPATAFEEPSDTTRTIQSLLVGGAFERYRDVTFIFAHGGGTLPFIADRMIGAMPAAAAFTMRTALARLYFDSASVVNPAAWAALINFTTPEHILFGTDFPYHTLGSALGGLKAMEQRFDMQPDSVQSIEAGNAQKLFASRLS